MLTDVVNLILAFEVVMSIAGGSVRYLSAGIFLKLRLRPLSAAYLAKYTTYGTKPVLLKILRSGSGFL